MDDFTIRSATASDLPAILEIWKSGVELSLGMPIAVDDYSKYFESQLRTQCDIFKFWVAESSEKHILGWQSLQPTRNNPVVRPHFAESSTYISPHSRSRGLGTSLIAHALQHASGTQIQYVTAFVSPSNEQSIRIAAALGFDLVGTVPASPKASLKVDLLFYVYRVPAHVS